VAALSVRPRLGRRDFPRGGAPERRPGCSGTLCQEM